MLRSVCLMLKTVGLVMSILVSALLVLTFVCGPPKAVMSAVVCEIVCGLATVGGWVGSRQGTGFGD